MSKRILVFEDQPDNRQIIRDMLAGADYEIKEAKDGERALAAVPMRWCRRIGHAVGRPPIGNRSISECRSRGQHVRSEDDVLGSSAAVVVGWRFYTACGTILRAAIATGWPMQASRNPAVCEDC
jgi:hypothetical protein